MTYSFMQFSNQFCSTVPTEVQPLSSGISSFLVTTANSIGTVCDRQSYMADSRFPAMDGSATTTTIDYIGQGIPGTIPTEFGLMTGLTQFDIGANEITDEIPTEIGRLTNIVTADDGGFLSFNEHDGATIPSELGALSDMTTGGGELS